MTRIVIVGGGYAGFYTAFKLEKLLRRNEAEVVVIDPLPYMTYQPFLPEVAAGSIEARHAIVPLRRHQGDYRACDRSEPPGEARDNHPRKPAFF